jgi:hypothetical protein
MSFLGDSFDFKWLNTRQFHSIEAPSYGGYANAKSLAKVSALMANGGVLDGVTLLSPEGYKAATTFDPPSFDYCNV